MKIGNLKFLFFFLSLVVITICFESCVKLKIEDESNKINLTSEKFFTIPSNTSEITKRVINEIKKKNEQREFITEFTTKEGFAIWDKAIINIKNNLLSARNNNIVGNDTIIIIPLVLQNTNLVSGFIEAVIDGSISLNSFQRTKYDTKPFGSLQSVAYTAEKYQFLMMKLDLLVFGIKQFKVIDNRLFGSTSLPNGHEKLITIEELPQQNLNEQAPCYSVTTEIYSVCEICHKYSCPLTTLLLSTWDVVCDSNTSHGDSGSPLGVPSNPNTGGGSGPAGNSPPVNTNPGTIPVIEPPIDIGNPCGVIDSLMKIPTYRAMLKSLRDSTNLDHEVGYSANNTLNESSIDLTLYLGSTIGASSAVSIDLASPADCVAHSHNTVEDRLPNASYEDIAKLSEYFIDSKVRNFRTFTYPIVTNTTSYILMISDSVKFKQFSLTHMNKKEDKEYFGQMLYYAFGYGATGLTDTENEINFLKCINSPLFGSNIGLSVFRGNADLSSFKKIGLNSAQTQVLNTPCLE